SDKKMVNGAKVTSWTCVSFSTRIDRGLPQEFCKQLIGMCVSKGMEFKPQPAIPFISCPPEHIEEALLDIHKRAPGLQLLIVILPDVTGSYGKIKRICETELGIVSQCCQPRQVNKLNKQYMENVALKINVKTGGRNTVL
uniref:Protein argonaute 5 n=1 Tax=Arabidopsis thaliana TaxID=3702 RepID=UPI00026E0F90|nr:Chain A, Protein argonaute 5 [Arabidopsis thaliana]4G0O_B Chain B, Protein argonaute 5 [Arabidopsis thaliana]